VETVPLLSFFFKGRKDQEDIVKGGKETETRLKKLLIYKETQPKRIKTLHWWLARFRREFGGEEQTRLPQISSSAAKTDSISAHGVAARREGKRL